MKKIRIGTTPIWLLLIAGLSAYGAFRHPWISYRECVKDPGLCRGRVIESFREPMIGTISSDGFILLQRGETPVFVHADTTGLKSGEYTGLKAVLREDGSLEAVRLVVARGRREKMIISLIPAALIVLLFLIRFRFDFREWMFYRRNRA
ncbi:MAG: hypothetical protein QUS35_00420 [bacterium]|nr:hypothetical protein [bacterium]